MNQAERKSSLLAISPLDGRYAEKAEPLGLRLYFSEYALFTYRLHVMTQWVLALLETGKFGSYRPDTMTHIETIHTSFSIEGAAYIKEIEASCNHDVKATEYYLREKLGNDQLAELVHFCCTSEDVNNMAYGMILKDALKDLIIPVVERLFNKLRDFAIATSDIPMLGRTHGQPASTTTVGKELAVFASRLSRQIRQLREAKLLGKFNGATGNLNAHVFTYPDINWMNFTEDFVESMGLTWNPLTTQIEPQDSMVELFDIINRVNNILVDLCRDMWTYISLGYFKSAAIDTEVGSTTMPHKVNPIDFENAEGNLGVSSALLVHLANVLPKSRLQRDLTNSTVLRNIGVAIGHALLAWESCCKGIDRVTVDTVVIRDDLMGHWEILAEPVQMMLRKHGVLGAYEMIKKLTRGKAISKETMDAIIASLPIPEDDKDRLLGLSPSTYTGDAVELVLNGDL